MLIEGTEEEPGPIAPALNEKGFALPPLPNLFFPRDIGMVVGRHAVVGSMRYGVRWTEELLVKTLFPFHPALANAGILYDGSEERRSNYTLEGGDVHFLRDDLLLLGFSERSLPAALDQLCDSIFEQGRVTDVIVVVMPHAPTAIHLDMIFTQLDRELCVVSPPFRRPRASGGPASAKGRGRVRDCPTSSPRCGSGARRSSRCWLGRPPPPQEREQWAPAATSSRCARGIVSYRRNEATLASCSGPVPHHAGGEFLAARWTGPSGRTVFTIEGGELVRGGGGPRCMTLPFRRRAMSGPAALPESTRMERGGAICRTRAGMGGAGGDLRWDFPHAPAIWRRASFAAALLGGDPGSTGWPKAAGPWCPWPLFPLLDGCGFAVVDVETTGMRAQSSDRITEIAVVQVGGEPRELIFESLIDPGLPIPPYSSPHHRDHPGNGAGGPPFRGRGRSGCSRRFPGRYSWPTAPASTGDSSPPSSPGAGARDRGSPVCTVDSRAGWCPVVRSCGPRHRSFLLAFENRGPTSRRRRRRGAPRCSSG